MEIIPAILTNDRSDFLGKIRTIEASRAVSRVHIDFVDSFFAEKTTLGPGILNEFGSELLLDAHLMVDEPVHWLKDLPVDCVIAQIERMSNQQEFVGQATALGFSVGLAIDLSTPVSALDPVILSSLDVVLVMAVEAGRGGQEFGASVLEKTRTLDEIRVRSDRPFRICVDGGIHRDTLLPVRSAGADEVVVGSGLFEGDFLENLKTLSK